jgi:hypothetical protein
MKICKTHDKHATTTTTTMIYTMIYDIFKHAPVFLFPHYPSLQLLYPSKKKQHLFIHFAFSLSISKKCCVVDDCLGI